MSARAGPLREAWRRLRRDRVGVGALVVVAAWLLVVAAVAAGWLAADWNREVAASHARPAWWPAGWEPAGSEPAGSGPSGSGPVVAAPTPVPSVVDPLAAELAQVRAALGTRAGAAAAGGALPATAPLGADRWGRDVLAKTLKGAQTSVVVGLAAALAATLAGTLLGALAGFHGGRVDACANWLYNVFTALPPVLLILAIAAVLGQRSIGAVVVILAATAWTGVFRVVRAEYLRQSVRDYVRAAEAIGASPLRRMLVHVLPNVAGVVLVQFTLLVVSCIKYEVILSYLGFGVPVDGVSWGTMLIESQNELLTGRWWQMASATAAMAVFVTALSLLGDAVRDALDPRGVPARYNRPR